MHSPHRPAVAPLTIFVLFACLYLLTSTGEFYSSDGEVMYQTAGALADRASLALDANPGLPQIVRDRNGAPVGKYEPGMPLLALPLYQTGSILARLWNADRAALTRLLVAFLPALCMAGAITGVYAAARRFAPPRRALVAALIAGVGALAWPYSRVLFPEAPLALWLAWAVWAALDRSPGGFALAGLFLGAAVATRAVNAVHLLPFAVFAWAACRARGVATLAAGALPGIVLVLAHNLVRFGAPFAFGYAGEGFTTPPLEGLWGLLFSSGKGVLWYSPPLIVAVLLWPRLRRRDAGLAGLLAGMAALALIVYGAWAVWHGGWAWGPRYLAPLVPLGMLPLALLPERRRTWSVALVAALAVAAPLQWAAVRANSNDFYAAMNVQNDPAALRAVLFDPAFSPIPAQFRLYAGGQRAPLVVAGLAR
ncbi:MAG: glycosyltransferase family 39 protein, partial [Anaerolineae bacterium]|nr:glycosyltransferase family 39 protein [Anaerolineae bacterium]